MKKVIIVLTTFVLITLASIGIHAQEVKKKNDSNKPTTTTIDAWRQALPGAEMTTTDAATTTVQSEPNETEDNLESAIEIEKTISGLERKLLAAFKQGDSATLSYLLADDFMAVGENMTDLQPNKTGYMDQVAKNSNLKSYNMEKMSVRVFGTTAVATVFYKHSAAATSSATDVDLVATDVWVKRGNLWQAVSHHISRMPKSQ